MDLSFLERVRHFFLMDVCLSRKLPGCFGTQEGKEPCKSDVDNFLLFI